MITTPTKQKTSLAHLHLSPIANLVKLLLCVINYKEKSSNKSPAGNNVSISVVLTGLVDMVRHFNVFLAKPQSNSTRHNKHVKQRLIRSNTFD